MNLKLIAVRYAKALRKYENENPGKPIQSDMAIILNTIQISKDLKVFLKNPSINNQKKFELLKILFQNKVCEESLFYLKLIVDKNREYALEKILKTYFEMIDEENGIINATIITAYELDEQIIEKIRKKIKIFTGKDPRFQIVVNSKVVGGLLIQIDDKVIDLTLKRQLEKIKYTFTEN
jgi:F-type H+-transporting ATPase subunit delta